MKDRELLDAAAKAAGIDYEHPFGSRSHPDFNEFVAWNPLTDDGDALRLAVKLGLLPSVFPCSNVSDGCTMVTAHDRPSAELWVEEMHNDDPYAATRRAIVRAAAEIGKAMTAD